MLTCRQTARLISDGLDRRLSLWQRMNLRLHIAICGACSLYRRQIVGLHRMVRQRSKARWRDDQPACPTTVKDRCIRILRDAGGSPPRG